MLFRSAEEGILSGIKKAGGFIFKKLKTIIEELIRKVKELIGRFKNSGKKMSKKELMERLKQAEADRDAYNDVASDYEEKYKKSQEDYKKSREAAERNERIGLLYITKYNQLSDTATEIKNCLSLSNKISMIITEIMKNIASSTAACNKLYNALDKVSFDDFDFSSNTYKKEISNLEYPIADTIIENLERLSQSYFDYGARYASHALKTTAFHCLSAAQDLLEKLNSIVKLLDSFKTNGKNYGKDLERMHNFYAHIVQSQISKVNLVIPIMQKISSVKNMIWVD